MSRDLRAPTRQPRGVPEWMLRCRPSTANQHTPYAYGQAASKASWRTYHRVGLDNLIAFFANGRPAFFNEPMAEYDLDAVLSINNYHPNAAVLLSKHPCRGTLRQRGTRRPDLLCPSHQEERLKLAAIRSRSQAAAEPRSHKIPASPGAETGTEMRGNTVSRCSTLGCGRWSSEH